MALLYCEHMLKYADDADIGTDNLNWTWGNSGGSIDSAAGRFGDNALHWTLDASYWVIPWAAITSSDTLIVNMAVKFELDGVTAPAGKQSIIRLSNSTAGNTHFSVVVCGRSGAIGVYGPSDVLLSSGAGFGNARVRTGVWHNIEFKVKMDDSAGTIDLKIDGVTVYTATGKDTRFGSSTAMTNLRLGGTEANMYTDHVIIMDDTGSAFNGFIGDVRLESKVPDADGSSTQWTASAGSLFQCVDDALGAYNDDTDYISETTTDEDALFSFGSFSLTGVSSIKGVWVSALARTDGTDSLALLAKSSATTTASATATLSSAYQWKGAVYAVDPNGGAAWASASAINSAEFGVRRKA